MQLGVEANVICLWIKCQRNWFMWLEMGKCDLLILLLYNKIHYLNLIGL